MKDNVIVGPWPGAGTSPMKLYVIVDMTGNLVGRKTYMTAGHAKSAVKTCYRSCGYVICSVPLFATPLWALAPDGTWIEVTL